MLQRRELTLCLQHFVLLITNHGKKVFRWITLDPQWRLIVIEAGEMEQWFLNTAKYIVPKEEIETLKPIHLALEGHMAPFPDLAMFRPLEDSG